MLMERPKETGSACGAQLGAFSDSFVVLTSESDIVLLLHRGCLGSGKRASMGNVEVRKLVNVVQVPQACLP
mgnify:CR=1 FL=1